MIATTPAATIEPDALGEDSIGLVITGVETARKEIRATGLLTLRFLFA
jgi:hypothetical protein